MEREQHAAQGYVPELLVVVGAIWGHHGGDAAGLKTGGLSDYLTASGASSGVKDVPVSQTGLNQLGNEAGHLRVSINFTWTLVAGFLVMFMQAGFALVETGFTRAKNAAHTFAIKAAEQRRCGSSTDPAGCPVHSARVLVLAEHRLLDARGLPSVAQYDTLLNEQTS